MKKAAARLPQSIDFSSQIVGETLLGVKYLLGYKNASGFPITMWPKLGQESWLWDSEGQMQRQLNQPRAAYRVLNNSLSGLSGPIANFARARHGRNVTQPLTSVDR